MNKESGINEPFDLEVISQTENPQEYGRIITTKYKCPCGKGKVVLTQEAIPGYYDFFTNFDCAECKEKFELLWGNGVLPGHSPMIRQKIV
jgi:hypothetical protein